jgi:hypothetical protein
LFPKDQQGTQYPDLYEEVASSHYTVESVFGTPTPKTQPSFHASKSRRPENKPVFVTEVKKKRQFIRPGESPTLRSEGEPITKANLFKPRF